MIKCWLDVLMFSYLLSSKFHISPTICQMELQHGDVLARSAILLTQQRLGSASGVQYYKSNTMTIDGKKISEEKWMIL